MIRGGGLKHVACAEDDDFIQALDKMMLENLQVCKHIKTCTRYSAGLTDATYCSHLIILFENLYCFNGLRFFDVEPQNSAHLSITYRNRVLLEIIGIVAAT